MACVHVHRRLRIHMAIYIWAFPLSVDHFVGTAEEIKQLRLMYSLLLKNKRTCLNPLSLKNLKKPIIDRCSDFPRIQSASLSWKQNERWKRIHQNLFPSLPGRKIGQTALLTAKRLKLWHWDWHPAVEEQDNQKRKTKSARIIKKRNI